MGGIVMADVIDYRIFGDDMQAVEIELDPGEGVRAEAGAMMFMEDGIEMQTSTGGGLFRGFKRMITGEPIPPGWTHKENGKRHFLNHEKASSKLLVEILKRYTFSMFFAGAGQKREKDLLKIVENHMQATLAFMPELRGEHSRQSFRDRAAELTWFICWDGRNFSLQNIHDFVLLWKADYEAKKEHSAEEIKIFEKIFKELIMVGLWQNDNLNNIDWDVFYKYGLEKGLKDQQLGKFKEVVKAKAMIEMKVKLDQVFLDKAYRKHNERR